MSIISRIEKQTKKKKFRPDTRFWARVLVFLLAVSMLAGTFYYVIFFATANATVNAADDASNPILRIAIMQGDYVRVGVGLVADRGFVIGYTNIDRAFTEITSITPTVVHVARHYNLKFSDDRYTMTDNLGETKVGTYHLSIPSTEETFLQEVASIQSAFPTHVVFPAYMYGSYYVMIGQSATKQLAQVERDGLIQALNDTSATTSLSEELIEAIRNATIIEPLNRGLMLVDPSTHHIQFFFCEEDGNRRFGIAPVQEGSETAYISAYHDVSYRKYTGVLECNPFESSTAYGVSMINLTRLDSYIAGVIPSEISSSWPIETLKAFAIAVRSYTLTHLYAHNSSYRADLCNEDHCQVFYGLNRATDRVYRAVEESSGLIAVYDGRICETYYSSSTGGCTAPSGQIWSRQYPYLVAVATPWEKYWNYGRGTITTTVTAEQLYQRLETRGYTALTGPVADVEITQYCTNSSYVYSIRFTDAAGNVVTIRGGDNIRMALGVYLYSDNFVVCKAGEDVSRTNYTKVGFGATNAELSLGLIVEGNPFPYKVFGSQLFYIATSDGTKTFNDSNSEWILTGNGLYEANLSYTLDAMNFPTLSGINGEVLPDITRLQTQIETETISTTHADNSFVFIGRGWGHGVGLSQYGIYDLGNLGYDFETIFKSYYTGVSIITYAEYLNG